MSNLFKHSPFSAMFVLYDDTLFLQIWHKKTDCDVHTYSFSMFVKPFLSRNSILTSFNI